MSEDERPEPPAAGGPSDSRRAGPSRGTRRRAPRPPASEETHDDDGGSQAGAINRSRPIYDVPQNNGRARRGVGPAGPRGYSGANRGNYSSKRGGVSRGDGSGYAPRRSDGGSGPYRGRPQGGSSRGPGNGGSGDPRARRTRSPGPRPEWRDGGDRAAPREGYERGPRRGTSRRRPSRYGTEPGNEARRPTRGPQGHGLVEDDRPALPDDPREAALRILHAVDTRAAFSDRLLESAHAQGGDSRDRALLHELVKGALRWRGRLDWALEARVHQGLAKTPPWIRNVLRLGAYQLLFLDRVPAHAVVDESVRLAHEYGHPGTAGLVNSVLRRLDAEKDAIAWPDGDDAESLSVWGSHPIWIVERWLERFGPEATRALLLADNQPARLGLRANPLRTTRDGLIARLKKDGVTAKPAERSPDMVWLEGHHGPLTLAAFRDGWCTVQDESESLVSRLVGPREHERVLDLCAAPGGKCTHIAELMGDEGEVWAMDRQASRLQPLRQNLERLGLHSVHVVEGDGRTYSFPMPFDRVLVDAPCSGLGVLGRRADARWRKGPEILREMPPLQLELLLAASRRARPGGVVVYSVCSFEPEETDAVVERFLRQDPSVVLESAQGAVPEDTVDEHGLMRVLPHVHGCDGAFAARFRKT